MIIIIIIISVCELNKVEVFLDPKYAESGVPQPPFTEKNLKNSIWNAPKQEVVQFFLSAEAEGGTLHIAKAQAVRLSIL